MTTKINDTYVNALLADASYVELINLSEENINDQLSDRLTKPLADMVTNNFEVLTQTGYADFTSLDGGFSATVWRGKVGAEYETPKKAANLAAFFMFLLFIRSNTIRGPFRVPCVQGVLLSLGVPLTFSER